jgi:hypothetical protein
MSEAEKSVNVEDVLSSIRRLVADGPRIVPEHPKPAFAADLDSAETAEAVVEPEASELTLEESAEAASFVDTMNASIAEMTEQIVDKHIDEDPVSEVEARVAHVDAFLASETAQSTEPKATLEDVAEKPEPFVLRAEMVADFEAVEPTVESIPEREDALSSADDDQEGYEISFHDTLEDDEAFLESVEDDEAVESEPPDADPAPEAALFDENALREIVGELVRAELQGDLGDRITRNVRKLVRREIHHALATRDFE